MNDWDIPELDIALAATDLVAPVTKWGTRRRDAPMPGTWHFYTYDFHFTALTRDPSIVPLTGCTAAVEANYSTYAEMGRAEALWGVYRKRLLARWWQAHGVKIIVDLNVDRRFYDLALLGVPEGWPSYATRVHRGNTPDDVEENYEIALAHAGTTPALFAVFGGGRKYKRQCLDRGWAWVPEHRQVVAGVEVAFGGF
jgi:hypothetical protein